METVELTAQQTENNMRHGRLRTFILSDNSGDEERFVSHPKGRVQTSDITKAYVFSLMDAMFVISKHVQRMANFKLEEVNQVGDDEKGVPGRMIEDIGEQIRKQQRVFNTSSAEDTH